MTAPIIHIFSTSIEQIEALEEVHAKLTENGWVIPSWLVTMRRRAEERDALIGRIQDDQERTE